MANVFITGTSTGIGEDAALRLDRQGHRVFAGVRRAVDGEHLAERASDRLVPVICDVADEASIDAAVRRIDQAVGPAGLQGVVNNAGVARGGPVEHLPLDEWRTQLEVNVIGQVAVTRAAIPLVRRGNGRICFVGSISGRLGSGLMGPYAASKFALEGIAQCLREELRPWGIKVSVIEPGPIKTPIWDKGRAYAAEIEAQLGPAALAQYRDQVDALVKGVDTNERIGASPSKTSDAIEHALFAARPKHRYLVGAPAKIAGPLTRFLPDKALDRLMRVLGP
jgi:NAD(P)-dependent dehydrogenase (short-subunit alcohol dehydrogenase family)